MRKENKFLMGSLKSSTVLLNKISCHEDQYRMKIGINSLVGSLAVPELNEKNEQTLKDSVDARIQKKNHTHTHTYTHPHTQF